LGRLLPFDSIHLTDSDDIPVEFGGQDVLAVAGRPVAGTLAQHRDTIWLLAICSITRDEIDVHADED